MQDKTKGRILELSHPLYLSNPNAFRSLIVWMYTDRLEASMSDVEAIKRLAKRCRLTALRQVIENEQRTLKYYFKTVRREEQPRRYSKYSLLSDCTRMLTPGTNHELQNAQQ